MLRSLATALTEKTVRPLDDGCLPLFVDSAITAVGAEQVQLLRSWRCGIYSNP
jgi:hypothetical protein